MTFEPEPEPSEADLFWLLLPEILEAWAEDAYDTSQRDALAELTRLTEEMGLYEQEQPAWSDDEEWADQAAEWLLKLQPAGTIWFNVEHDDEAARREKTYRDDGTYRQVPRARNKARGKK